MPKETDVDIVYCQIRKAWTVKVDRKKIAIVARDGNFVRVVWFDATQKLFRRDELETLVAKRLGLV